MMKTRNRENPGGCNGKTLADLDLLDYEAVGEAGDMKLLKKVGKPYTLFTAVELIATYMGSNIKLYEVIFSAECTFDGVRHIWFTPDEDPSFNGYLHYPDFPNLVAMLQLLEAEEEKIAWEKYGNPPPGEEQ